MTNETNEVFKTLLEVETKPILWCGIDVMFWNLRARGRELFYFYKMTNKMQLCRIIYCSLAALHVSSDIFAHHQEHLNCIYSFWFYSRVSLSAAGQQPTTTHVNKTRSCKYS